MKLSLIVGLLVSALVGCTRPGVKPSCTMNGRGQGHCDFTSVGKKAGGNCGVISVHRVDTPEKADSDIFCSGEVAANSTVKVDFTIPAVDTMCSREPGKKWTEECVFTFEAVSP